MFHSLHGEGVIGILHWERPCWNETSGAGFGAIMNSIPRRSTRRRYSFWERIKVHPGRDREKIDALKTDMVRAFMKGDLETYWKLDRELRWN
jgi:hypothetical protein